MFKWTKDKIIKSVAKELPPRLTVKYGKKDSYTQEEIDWALVAVNKDRDINYKNYAYGMLTDHSLFLSLGLSSSLGSYEGFQKGVSEVLFKQECPPNMDLYLDYSSNQNAGSQTASTDLGEHSSDTDSGIGGE
ncbi:hypothetical protein L4D15_23845 [Enterovibrio norvegicus]|uniref:DUF6559 family protein n=1 Tax=Enterovibrio norvegicus TaxID=188144 RepID=UPI003D12FC90